MRGYKEERTTTTPFDMCVLNEIDRYHLVQHVIDRLPQLGARAGYVKQTIRDALIDHKEYIHEYGENAPEISGWTWVIKQLSAHLDSTSSDNVEGVEAPIRN